MTARRPLAVISGVIQEFPVGDLLAEWVSAPPNPSAPVTIADDFLNFSTAADEIGELGWNFAVAPTNVAAVAGHPGIKNLASAATSGDQNNLRLGTASGDVILPQDVERFIWVVRPGTNTVQDIWIGLMDGASSNHGGSDAVYFEHEASSSANWRTVTRTGAAETANSSTVAVTVGNWYQLEARRLSDGNWEFHINNVLQFTHSTHLPTTGLNVAMVVRTNENVAKNIDVDYFAIRTVGAQRWT